MEFKSDNSLDQLLNVIFEPYKTRVPDVGLITKAMIREGMIDCQEDIVNDHIAFRTLGVQNLGIQSLEKIFIHFGYRKMDYYAFEKKKLNAFWYAPPSEKYPRIFISELKVEELSGKSQEIIKKYTAAIFLDPVEQLNLDDPKDAGAFFNQPLWDLPTYEDYKALADESEYASWVIYNRFYLNHYTISIHDLPKGYDSIETFNSFVEAQGVLLNQSGGVVKTSKDGLLRQSSSVAKMVKAKFGCGVETTIPGSYVEFAERSLLPEYAHMDGVQRHGKAKRREGFESANADKIFESTYKVQTKRLAEFEKV